MQVQSAQDVLNKWRPKTADIPTNPGVYKWRDSQGRVLYVGKAKNLRARLTSYFKIDALAWRTAQMVEQARSLEWTVVGNEIEALTLEYQWIGQFDPKFNVIFRNDDKSYPYIAISKEKTPRVWVTREKRHRSVKHFGPFPKSWALRQSYSILQQIFGFRSCSKGVFDSAVRQKKPCLLGYIEKCSAPCSGKITNQEYTLKLDQFQSFLRGNYKPTLKKLNALMSEAAQKEEFEKAAAFRDGIEAVKEIVEKNSVELATSENCDIIGIYGDEIEVAIHCFVIRKGLIVGEKTWIAEHNDDDETINAIFGKLYFDSQNDVGEFAISDTLPSEIVISKRVDQTVVELLKGMRKSSVKVHEALRGDKRRLLEKANENAKADLERARLKRTNDLRTRTEALNELQIALNLPSAPLRMECYDVSHTMGEFQTASMVVFEDGLPKKSAYRLFNIKDEDVKEMKTVKDDTAAIYQVISRRLARLNRYENKAETENQKFAYDPNLIVIDGGVPQVNAAWRAVKDAGLESEINVVSLAKRLEEIWQPNQQWPVILSRNSNALYILQHLRDEAHRFSIVNMRKRRGKKFLKK